MALTYVYNKLRSNFGRQPMFCVARTDMYDSIAPNPLEQRHYILRNPVRSSTQDAPSYKLCEVNTIRAEYVNRGMSHPEGGWPEFVNINDPEATQRYRRKVEKDDGYIHCVSSLAPELERLVLQNNAIEMYQTYYAELPSMPAVEQVSCRTVNVYIASGYPRPVSSICWSPEGGSQFAATYVDVDFDLQPRSRSPVSAYIWDVENPNEPERTITPPCPLLDLQYNQKDACVLAGALMSGGVAVWDTRGATDAPSLACPPHVAHREMARSVRFISSKSGKNFFSGGADGVVKWWDMRNMSRYTDQMIIHVVQSATEVQSMAQAEGVSALEFEQTIPSRFMIGTENGFVITGNRKGKTPVDKLPVKYPAHMGPVWRIERNPGFLKNFLTVGDWTARVWSEDCKESAVWWTPPARHRVTDARWSPTRWSLVLQTQYDGRLLLWDLLRRQTAPALSVQVCDEPLACLQVHSAGALVVCGSSKGSIYMQELSPSLVVSDKNDKTLLSLMFEREGKRERILEARMREIRLKLRQALEGSPARSATELDAAAGDRDLADATQEFMQVARKELGML